MIFSGRVVFVFWLALILSGLAACATTIPVTIPRFQRKNGLQLRNVLEGRRNLVVIAARADSKSKKKLGRRAENWGDTMEAVVSKSLSELGYYNIIDVSGRKERLKELAYSQSGLTQESLEIGRELQAQTFLVVRMTRPPKVKCKLEEAQDYITTALAVTARTLIAPDSTGSVNTNLPTGVLYVSIFVEGKLTNIETGRSVSHVYSKTKRIESKAGNRSCISPYKAFGTLLGRAGKQLALYLSPKLKRLSVPLMKDSKDIKNAAIRSEIEPYLLSGIEWAKSGDMDEARDEWEEALRKSNDTSGAAIWNLAVYYWHISDFEKADQHFEQMKRKKLRLLNPEKRRIIAFFNKEKKAVLK